MENRIPYGSQHMYRLALCESFGYITLFVFAYCQNNDLPPILTLVQQLLPSNKFIHAITPDKKALLKCTKRNFLYFIVVPKVNAHTLLDGVYANLIRFSPILNDFFMILFVLQMNSFKCILRPFCQSSINQVIQSI